MQSSWIGPWYWEASVRVVSGGNIPPEYPRITLRLTFKDGGSSDFETKFVEIKGRLHHAAQIAQETGQRNWAHTVHDEQLPEYSAPPGGGVPSQTTSASDAIAHRADEAARQAEANRPSPDEPPPDYDSAQAQAVSMRFDDAIREEAERR